MKRLRTQRIVTLFCLLLSGTIFSSCQKEERSVYDHLFGSWVITNVSQAHPMTMRFTWDMGELYCEIDGMEAGVTPYFSNYGHTHTVKALCDKDGAITLEFISHYFDAEGYMQTEVDAFDYVRVDDDTFSLTERIRWNSSNNRTFTFIRR